MLKNTLLIALVIAIIYLSYQNKKLKGWPASSDNSAQIKELITAKEQTIAQLRTKKYQVEISLTSQLQELKKKYSQQSRLLDEEQLENNKLTEQVAELEAELEQLKKDHEWPPLNTSPKTKK